MPKHVVCWLLEGSFCNTRFIESDCLIGEGLSAVGCTDLERGIRTAATKREEHNVILKDEPSVVIEEYERHWRIMNRHPQSEEDSLF